MAQVQQKVYLITEQQRDALLNYFLDRPYREVANGVQFLNNAPTTIVNIEVPDEKLASIPAEQQAESLTDTQEEAKIEVVNSPAEELAMFSHA